MVAQAAAIYIPITTLYWEVRIRAIGVVEGFVLHLVYTDRGVVRRIIPLAWLTGEREANGTPADEFGRYQSWPPRN
jgi:hypothetical protein